MKILLLSLRVFLVLITTIIIDQESDVLNIMYLLWDNDSEWFEIQSLSSDETIFHELLLLPAYLAPT
jgi:hypothetical protein